MRLLKKTIQIFKNMNKLDDNYQPNARYEERP